MESIKILALGISQSNFLNQLYGDLKQKYDKYEIGINGYYDISKGQIKDEEGIFSEYFDFNNEKITRYQSFKSFLKLIFTKTFWQIYFFERSQGKSMKEAYYFLRSFAYDKVVVKQHVLKTRYELYHFHYCNPAKLKYLHHFPNSKKVICSFWGSDLMRETGINNVYYVRKALEKATMITIQNTELAEILFCKYGRELENKTNIIQFTINTAIYDFIDKFRNDEQRIEKFKLDYNIPLHKTVIAVSHNGFSANNHIKIMRSIEQLPPEVKNRIVLLLPLGYGRNEDYFHILEMYKQSSTIELVLLHQFFGPEETALLRLCTDVMIQMPKSDALSGAMTEVLYAGNHVIVGGWLPYGLLRRKGIKYTEIENFSQVGAALEVYLSECQVFIDNNSNNAVNIQRTLFPNVTTFEWNILFTNLS